MSNWGLTEYGFLRPSYNDLLDAFELRAKELFGANINLSSRSPLGIFLRIFAWFTSLAWELAEAVYNSGFIDTAEGNSLARLGGYIGIQRLAAQAATGTITITGDAGASVPAGFIVQSINGQRFVTLFAATIGTGGTVDAAIQAYEAGPDGNVSAGAITTIVTPLAAVTSVTNAYPTEGGRDRETDQEFRERYLQSIKKPGSSNVNIVLGALLEVTGVVEAVVWENDTNTEDADGLPPHSIEAIVYGGYDYDIATAIFERKAAGIATSGTVAVQLLDSSGRQKTIKFSRPEAVDVYVNITSLVTNDDYEGDGAIVDAIINYVGSETGSAVARGLAIGETCYYNRLIQEVGKVTGVIDFSLETSADGVTYGTGNIVVTARQKAVTSGDLVVIST